MYEASVTLIPKPDNDRARKGKAVINKDTKILTWVLAK